MKLGFIVPTAYLEDFAVESDYHLVLVHILDKDSKYLNFYRKRSEAGDFITVDNAIFELEKAYPDEKIIELAHKVKAAEIVVPEVLKSGTKSLKVMEKFLKKLDSSALKDFKFAAAIQGSDCREFLTHYKILVTHFGDVISTVCIPFDIDCYVPYAPKFPLSPTLQRVVNRIGLIHFLTDFSYFDSSKEYHLLGLSDGVELQHYQTSSIRVRSNDSSSPFIHGVNGILYEMKGLPCEKIPEKLNFSMRKKLSSSQTDAVLYNIGALKFFCREGDL